MSDKKFMYYAGNRFGQTMEQAKHLAKLATELGGVDIRAYPVGDIRELKEENTKLREQVNRLQRQSELMKTTLIELKLHASRAIGDMINSTLTEVQELDNA